MHRLSHSRASPHKILVSNSSSWSHNPLWKPILCSHSFLHPWFPILIPNSFPAHPTPYMCSPLSATPLPPGSLPHPTNPLQLFRSSCSALVMCPSLPCSSSVAGCSAKAFLDRLFRTKGRAKTSSFNHDFRSSACTYQTPTRRKWYSKENSEVRKRIVKKIIRKILCRYLP